MYIAPLRPWAYLGFHLAEHSIAQLVGCFILSVAPALVIRTRINRLSTFLLWFVYFFVYVPSILIPVLQGYSANILPLIISLFLSFSLMAIFSRANVSLPKIKLSRNLWKVIFFTSYATLNAYLIWVFQDHMQLVAIDDIYSHRKSAGETISGTYVTYAIFWLGGAFNPFLIASGLLYKKSVYIALGMLGQTVIYMAVAMKAPILSIPLIFILYYLISRANRATFKSIASFCVPCLAIPIAIGFLFNIDNKSLIGVAFSIIFMRTYAMAGGLTGVYHSFFEANPNTHYSHINLVGQFIDYPYDQSLGRTIGQSLGSPTMNANANFFATDGIAAAGILGVLLIGPVIGLTLAVFDSIIPKGNVYLACIASIPAIISLSNTSFFTTLMTGGLFIVVLLASTWRAPNCHHLEDWTS